MKQNGDIKALPVVRSEETCDCCGRPTHKHGEMDRIRRYRWEVNRALDVVERYEFLLAAIYEQHKNVQEEIRVSKDTISRAAEKYAEGHGIAISESPINGDMVLRIRKDEKKEER